MSEINGRTEDDVRAIAEAKGLIMVIPTSKELTLDIDNKVKIWNEGVLVTILSNKYTLLGKLWTVSASGNWHLWIRLDRYMDPLTRIVMQAAMGSDPTREILSMIRHNSGAQVSSTVFETEKESKRVLIWRESFETLMDEDEGLAI